MAKTLDFNDVKLSTLPIVMKDEAHTNIHVAVPTVELVEKIQEQLPALQAGAKKNDQDSILMLYGLAAELISVNREGVAVDGVKLRNEYKLDLGDLLVFFVAYLEFIAELKNAKN